MFERRVVFSIGVTYETPRDKLQLIPEIIREAVEAQEKTRFDRSNFSKFGDFALLFETVFYVLSPDYNVYMDIQQAIYFNIHERFEQEGIEFAYPTQKLFVTKN
jgi:small-conductance mechanosensitive channel